MGKSKYAAITRVLKKDPTLSLDIDFSEMDYGVKNLRRGGICEPNPNEGREHDYGEQGVFREGPRRDKEGYHFNARDVYELLRLVNRACKGEKGVESKVSEIAAFPGEERETVHGYEEPRGGLDNWIFAGMQFNIHQQDGILISTMQTYHFPDRYMVVSRDRVDTVDQAIAKYTENPQDMEILRQIKGGAKIRERLQEKGKERVAGLSKRCADAELIREYRKVLRGLAPIKISPEAKDAIFAGIVSKKILGVVG